MNQVEPNVAIILVNYNGYVDTVECIKALKKMKYENYEIIVVDNGSDNKNYEYINQIKEQADYIWSSENTGFAGGNNIGIKFAKKKYKPDFYLLINNDTVVDCNFLSRLVDNALDSKIGIVCGKILYFDAPNIVWFAGGTYDKKKGLADHVKYNQMNDDNSSYTREDDFATGCLWLIPSNTIELVGLLDESYFLYAEDTDYCCRVRNIGLKILYVNDALIYHKVSKSSRSTDLLSYYMVRNNLYIAKKYSTNRFYAYFYQGQIAVKNIICGEKRMKPVFRAIRDFRKGITGSLKVF